MKSVDEVFERRKSKAFKLFLKRFEEETEPVQQTFAYYRCAIMEVETKFNVLNEMFSLKYDENPIEYIESRLKSFDSIIDKMERKGYPLSLRSMEQNVQDIAGVRVVCSFEQDIYTLAECLLQQDDVVLIEKRDYIKNPKPGGYRSLHLIIRIPIFLENEKRMMTVEVQLRTIAMDFWASLEHKIRYKKNLKEEYLQSLGKEMLECARISHELDKRMQSVHNQLKEKDQ